MFNKIFIFFLAILLFHNCAEEKQYTQVEQEIQPKSIFILPGVSKSSIKEKSTQPESGSSKISTPVKEKLLDKKSNTKEDIIVDGKIKTAPDVHICDLDSLIKIYEKEYEAKKNTENARKLALLYILKDEKLKALDLFERPELSQDDLSEYIKSAILSRIGEYEKSFETLNHIMSKSREYQKLKIKNIQFCESVNWVGEYKTFEKNEFSPNQKVLLYFSIENFTLQKVVDGFKVHIEFDMKLFKPGDEPKLLEWKSKTTSNKKFQKIFQEPVDDTAFCIMFDIPNLGSSISPEEYELRFYFKDMIGDKTTDESIKFVIK